MDLTNPADADWLARNRQRANASLEEGDQVRAAGDLGVIVDVLTASDWTEGDTLPDSNLNPNEETVYVVAFVDERDFGFYAASALMRDEIDVEVPEPPDSSNAIDRGFLRLNLDWSHPPSWRKSPKPARYILLKAWANMGGTHRACTKEIRGPRDDAFCAAMKDEVLGFEGWRGGWAE
jgi:hypothetical protein